MTKIFISYSHIDEVYKDRLVKHLKVLEMEGYYSIWDDRRIQAGDDWQSEIENALKTSQIAVLLISPDFLTSDFIRNSEIPVMLARRKSDGMKLIPLIIKPCTWKKISWLSRIQALPKDGTPLISGDDYFIESCLTDLAERLYKVAGAKEKKTSSRKPVVKKTNVYNISDYNTKPTPKPPKTKETVKSAEQMRGDESSVFQQIANGNSNIQVGGDYYNVSKPPIIKSLPPVNSIGNDSLLKQRIQGLFNKIGDERAKRFGKSAYSVLNNNFKRDFGIKNQPYTVIYLWPKECAQVIIDYLQEKYSNTIKGRMERASAKPDYIPTKPQLFAKEKVLLEQIGLTIKSLEVNAMLAKYFGVNSHTELSRSAHWQFVCYLEGLVRDTIGE